MVNDPQPPTATEPVDSRAAAKERQRLARQARIQRMAEDHPHLSRDEVMELYREDAARRVAAEQEAAAARRPPPRPDHWTIGKEAWVFCRTLFRIHGIVLEQGEYARMLRAVRRGVAERVSDTPPVCRVVHERTGTPVLALAPAPFRFGSVLRRIYTPRPPEPSAQIPAAAPKAEPPPAPAPARAKPSRAEVERLVREKVIAAFPGAGPREIDAKVAKVLARAGARPKSAPV